LAAIPGGYDPDELHSVDKREARRRLGIDPARPVILQLGRLVPRKGIGTVVEALGLLKRARGTRPQLLVVGGESDRPDPALTPEIARLQKMAAELGVEDQLVFAGRRARDELKYYYGAADIFVTTPWYEPFGITPLEAMACGTPVVGSAV